VEAFASTTNYGGRNFHVGAELVELEDFLVWNAPIQVGIEVEYKAVCEYLVSSFESIDAHEARPLSVIVLQKVV
jgi:hypothetical protein